MPFKCVQQKTGHGIATTTHASAINELGVDGTFQPVAPDAPLWRGSRRVENHLTYSGDFDNAVWTPTNLSVTDNADGTADLSPVASGDSFLSHDSIWTADYETILVAIDVKGVGTAIGKTFILRSYADTGVNQSVTLTSVYQRVYLGRVTGSLGTQTHLLLVSAVNGADIPIDGVVVVRRAQEEFPLGDASTLIPSEYVATTNDASVEYYANANGNSVASGIVTESVGAILTNQPYLKYQVAATNIIVNSRDLTGWLEIGSTDNAYNQVGMNGKINHASYIEDNDGAAYEYVYKVFTITSNTSPITLRVSVLKETIGTYFQGVKFAFSNDGSGVRKNFNFNKQTGDIDISFDGGLVTTTLEVVDMGSWWGVIVEADNISVTSVYVAIYGGIGTSLTVNSAAATGNVIIGNVEIFENKTADEIRDLSPVINSGSTVPVNETEYAWDIANHGEAQGMYQVEVNWTGGNQDILLINSVAFLSISGTTLTLSDGTNTATKTIAVGEHKIGIAYGGSAMKLNLNNSWSTEAAYDGAFGSTGDITTKSQIRELKRENKTYADAQTVIDAWMTA